MYSCFLVRPLASAYFLENRGKTVPQIFHSFQDSIVSCTLNTDLLIKNSSSHNSMNQLYSRVLLFYVTSSSEVCGQMKGGGENDVL